MDDLAEQILPLADGERTVPEIARLLGTTRKRVETRMKKHNMPRCKQGAQPGSRNHQYVCGRRVDLDGYVLVTAPTGHPHARQRPNRVGKIIYEHRLVMEKKLGRYLSPEEVVDHIDGLTLHNAPDNLRLFESNGEHLAATISGTERQWSEAGRVNIGARTDRGREIERVDTYRQRRKRGDVRLRAILRAALQLGTDSPYLSGTRHHLQKAGIVGLSRPNLERAWDDLSARWEADLLR